jgi:hypothetical protein
MIGNPEHDRPHQATLAEGVRRARWISLPHEGAILRYDPTVFD